MTRNQSIASLLYKPIHRTRYEEISQRRDLKYMDAYMDEDTPSLGALTGGINFRIIKGPKEDCHKEDIEDPEYEKLYEESTTSWCTLL